MPATNLNNTPETQTSLPRPPALSSDGYIRLRLPHLSALQFVHLASERDSSFLAELQAKTVPARAAGFCEWMSNSMPAVSVGWGWFIHNPSNRLLLAPEGVRSNVMLTDIYGYDLGPIVTSNLFGTWLTSYDWQKAVIIALQGSWAD